MCVHRHRLAAMPGSPERHGALPTSAAQTIAPFQPPQPAALVDHRHDVAKASPSTGLEIDQPRTSSLDWPGGARGPRR